MSDRSIWQESKRWNASTSGSKRLKQELEAEAREKGVSPSESSARRWKSTSGSETHANCRDIAGRMGILGVYKDAPPDLSTNPEHMEGFGRD